jgi:adenine phosphoribosyltransferase
MVRDLSWLTSFVRDIPDFPEPGIVFKDLTPLLGDAEAFRYVVDALVGQAADPPVDKVVGIEARGFTFAAAAAYRLDAGLVPVRKPGKLPYDTVTMSYQLEYGSDALEIHQDAITPGESIYIIDDILATGGTAAATYRLVESLGGRVSGIAFVAELGFLNGRAKLPEEGVYSLLTL